MSTLHAAYCLGRNARTVEFTVRYYIMYWGVREIEYGRNMRDCLHWIVEDLTILGPALTDRIAVETLCRDVELLRNKLDVSRLSLLEASSSVPEDILLLARSVMQTARGVLRFSPALFPWFRLGDSVGRCYECLLDETQKHMPSSVQRLLRVAATLPERRRNHIVPAARLAATFATNKQQAPVLVISDAVETPVTPLELELANVYIIRKVQKLDERLREELKLQPDPAIMHLTHDPTAGASIILGSRAFPVSNYQSAMLTRIYRAQGRIISGPAMMRADISLEDANLGREVERLPDAIKCHLERRKGPGGGFAWID